MRDSKTGAFETLQDLKFRFIVYFAQDIYTDIRRRQEIGVIRQGILKILARRNALNTRGLKGFKTLRQEYIVL